MSRGKLSRSNKNDLGRKEGPVLLGLTRSSTQEVAAGYGPSIQKAELEQDAKRQHYKLLANRDIVEPATIDLEDRELFKEVFAEAVKLTKQGKCDGLAFSRCDRMSRRFDAALQIALDCKKNGLTLRFIREDQWLRPDDEPLQFIMLTLQAFGVAVQTGITIRNMNAGRMRAAADGKLPSGVGAGMIGYTLVGKKFETNSSIVIADEILQKALRGRSINGILADLQKKGIRNQRGEVITRSTVYRVLKRARRYAGIWDWCGHEITLLPPIITLEQAGQILANLKRNKEKSLGYGKRKWLTSRVYCGLCGRRYILRVRNACACLRSTTERAVPPCTNVTVSWKRLSGLVWYLFINCITSFDTLEVAVQDRREAWKAKKAEIETKARNLQEQVAKLQQKRRLYSWQQAEGIISEELLAAHKQLKSEESILNEQLARLEEFRSEPSPPNVAAFRKLAEYWSGEISYKLWDAPDDVKDRFAELFDLRATIHPDSSKDGYHIDLTANMPLETEGKDPSAYEMVFSPSRGDTGVRS
jgi:DNA invertase Pin-like site-specific DNA recombinase